MSPQETRQPERAMRLECAGCGHGMRICGPAARTFTATCPRCFEEGVYAPAQAAPWPQLA